MLNHAYACAWVTHPAALWLRGACVAAAASITLAAPTVTLHVARGVSLHVKHGTIRFVLLICEEIGSRTPAYRRSAGGPCGHTHHATPVEPTVHEKTVAESVHTPAHAKRSVALYPTRRSREAESSMIDWKPGEADVGERLELMKLRPTWPLLMAQRLIRWRCCRGTDARSAGADEANDDGADANGADVLP